jgi:transposase
MRLHGNARTCPHSRLLIVRRVEEEGWSLAEAAAAAGVSERTASKWLARWRAEGVRGLHDLASAPRRIPHRTAAAAPSVRSTRTRTRGECTTSRNAVILAP